MLKRVISSLMILFLLHSCKIASETKKKKASDTVIGTAQVLPLPEQELPYKLIKFDSERLAQLIPKTTIWGYYDQALTEIELMLENKRPLDFKKAVFISENAFFEDSINYSDFNNGIQSLVDLCKVNFEANHLVDYPFSDSINIKKNGSIFKLMNDKLIFTNGGFDKMFHYNFEDYTGSIDWSNQFVMTLLTTKQGNCHSLPFLYKILANELQAEAFLSLAPNHLYIKNQSEKLGWYNTELTSGFFPTDAWVKASGYISIQSIRTGIYMDTLSDKQSVALCIYDLAKGYLSKNKENSTEFVLRCCDLILKHHPQNINAIILKAETLKKMYGEIVTSGNKQKEAIDCFQEMQGLYVKGLQLGYREMPSEMYQEWLLSIKTEQAKYHNAEVTRTLRSN